jgi:capsular polysaccharide biosynthesis protein/Mrp family chromosome partitioning ATPase
VARYYVVVFRRWFWLLGLCTLLGGVGAYMGSKLIPPTYQATTLLVVGQQTASSDVYNGVLASTQLIPTYMSLMAQPVVLQRAAAQVGGVSAQQLAGRIHITDQAGTQIIELDVDDASPIRAAQLANAIASTFVTMQRQAASAALARQQQQADQQLAKASAQVSALNAQIDALRNQDPNNPRLQGLEQQLFTAQAQQSALQTTSDQLAAQAITATDAVSVFQVATPPPLPDHPKPFLNAAIGGALGLVIAAALVWLLEFFDKRIRTPDRAEALLDLPVLGAVGRYSGRALLLEPSPSRKLAMDMQALVAKLELAHFVEPPRAIAVTSAGSGEGRTTIAVNLAVALACNGKRVLLVDGDLHQQTRCETLAAKRQALTSPLTLKGASHINIQELLDRPEDRSEGRPSSCGLSLVLTSQAYQTADITAVQGVRGLSVLPSGPSLPDTAALFRSVRIRHFLQWQLGNPAGGQFDTVVFDTPPADTYPDATLLGRWADATILVVDATQSEEQPVQRVKDRLLQSHANITGIVLNRASARDRDAKLAETQSIALAADLLDLDERQDVRADPNDPVSQLAARESEDGSGNDPPTP